MEKKKLEIDKCLEIYDILEEFSYKFPREETEKKWRLYNQPKVCMDLIT